MEERPKMLTVGDTIEKLVGSLAHDSMHPGLKAGLASLEGNRHPTLATLMLLGITGAGKSSTVNSLFDGPLAETGDTCSVSKEITEYEINVPIPEIGVSNTKLRIVDTPGFGDTADPVLDAQLLASLQKYLGQNYTTSVTCLLVVGKFDDDRFAGPNSPFVKMLKAVESLGDRQPSILGGASIVFILTRFMNGKKVDRKDPTNRLLKFHRVISEYTRFIEPVILVAESEGEEADLERDEVSGFYQLPNGEYFPYNIFKGIQSVIRGVDPMGEWIIRSVYKNIKQFGSPTKTEIKLVAAEDSAVPECSEILGRISSPILKNEVTTLLEETWITQQQQQTEESKVELGDENFLKCVQRTFQRKGIQSMENLPQTKRDVMLLVQDLPRQPQLVPLLANALGIQVQKLDTNLLTGYSYNIAKDCPLNETIFQTNNSKWMPTPLGFCIPDHLLCQQNVERKDRCEFFNSRDEYIQARINELGATGGGLWNGFGGKANFSNKVGYNMTTDVDAKTFTATREFRSFSLLLCKDVPVTQRFTENVQRLPPKFNPQDETCVDQYARFFDQFGTHVVTAAFGGGQLEVVATSLRQTSDQKSVDTKTIQAGLSFALLKCLEVGGNWSNSTSSEYSKLLDHYRLSFRLRGGSFEPSCQQLVNSAVDIERGDEVKMQLWVQSLLENPTMLQTELQLLPISIYVGMVRSDILHETEAAALHLFGADLQCPEMNEAVPNPRRREEEPEPSADPFNYNGLKILEKFAIETLRIDGFLGFSLWESFRITRMAVRVGFAIARSLLPTMDYKDKE